MEGKQPSRSMCAAEEGISTKQVAEKNLLGRERNLIKALHFQHTKQDSNKNLLAIARNPIEARFTVILHPQTCSNTERPRRRSPGGCR